MANGFRLNAAPAAVWIASLMGDDNLFLIITVQPEGGAIEE